MQKRLIAVNTEIPIRKDVKYTSKINIPQYEPSAICPELWELCDKTKYYELVRKISLSNIPDNIKEFLKYAATRHIVFNYSKIADYYANAEPEVQRLMEQSALVIIDMDDAIANGYVKLSKNIENIMLQSGCGTKQ